MHIKFLARGTGSARAAADYLLGARDATGQPREGVEVLRGDPHQVAVVADALAFEHKYTSGVIAWAPDVVSACSRGIPRVHSDIEAPLGWPAPSDFPMATAPRR